MRPSTTLRSIPYFGSMQRRSPEFVNSRLAMLDSLERMDVDFRQKDAQLTDRYSYFQVLESEKRTLVRELSDIKYSLKQTMTYLLRQLCGAVEAICDELRLSKENGEYPDPPELVLPKFMADNRRFNDKLEKIVVRKNFNLEEAKKMFPILWNRASSMTETSIKDVVELVDGDIFEGEIYCFCALFKLFHFRYQRYRVDGTKYTEEDDYN
jgi:hypothetical protein